MPFGGAYSVIVLLQVLCLAHAMHRRADQRWFYLLVFVPGIGCVVYFLVEVLPRLRAHGPGAAVPLPFFERRRLRRLEEQLRWSDTIENRVALADAYVANARGDEALALVEPCLDGVPRNDPYLLLRYAELCLGAGEPAKALAALDRVDPNRSERARHRHLARGRALDALGRVTEAEATYRLAAKGFDGEEARVRLADFLWRQGRRDQARELYRETIEYARINERPYRRREKPWIAQARARLQEADPAASAAA